MAKLIFNNSCVQRAQLAVASLGYLLQRRGTQWRINSANRNETMWISQSTQRLCNDDRKTFYLESKQSLEVHLSDAALQAFSLCNVPQ